MKKHWKRITAAALAGFLCAMTMAAPLAIAADSGTSGAKTDSRAGVVAAVGCGLSASLAVRTGAPPFYTVAVFFCAYMIFDALSTPD